MSNFQNKWNNKDQEYEKLELKEVLGIFVPFEFYYSLNCQALKVLNIIT